MESRHADVTARLQVVAPTRGAPGGVPWSDCLWILALTLVSRGSFFLEFSVEANESQWLRRVAILTCLHKGTNQYGQKNVYFTTRIWTYA